MLKKQKQNNNKKHTPENDPLTGHFQSFFIIFFRPPDPKSEFFPVNQLVEKFWHRTISIHHEYEGVIEISILKITVCHHEASRVMTNGDLEGQVFLPHPHTNNGFLFMLTIFFLFSNTLPEALQYHMMTSLNNHVLCLNKTYERSTRDSLGKITTKHTNDTKQSVFKVAMFRIPQS